MQEAEQALYGCDSLLSWREEGSLAYRFNTEHQADMSEMKEVFEDAFRSVKTVRAHLISLFYRFHSFGDFDKLGDNDFDVSTMKVPDKKLLHRQYEKWIILS